MTNRNKRRPSGYRASGGTGGSQIEAAAPRGGGRAAPPPRRGLLGGIFASRMAESAMPRMSTCLGRGVIAAASSPAIVTLTMLVVPVVWLAFVALGLQGPFSVMASFLALFSIGTTFDALLAVRLFGAPEVVAIFSLITLRAVLLALYTSLALDALTGSRSDRWSVVRALRILPVTLAVTFLCLGLTIVSQSLPFFLGSGIGLLASVGALVAGVYVFGFAPAIALSEERKMADSLSRSLRAARMPGTSNLTFAAVYTLGAFAVLIVSGGGKLGVNPSPLGWAAVLFISFLQAAMIATLAFRYLSVAEEVPDAPAPRERPVRARRR